MAVTNFSPLLGLALPTTGDLSGTWGTTVNDSITQLIDSAVAGTTVLSADADVTLSTTNGAANQARNAIIRWTASNGATTRNITAPAQSKAYVVINKGTGNIVIRGSGPTTGAAVAVNEKCLVAWDGSDFVKIASTVDTGVGSISFGTTGLTPATPTSGAVTVGGVLAVANGGSGSSSPSLVGGTNITISGSWPNQTVAASSSSATAAALVTANFTVEQSGGKLVFKYGSTVIGSMSSTGVFTTLSDVVSNGTP